MIRSDPNLSLNYSCSVGVCHFDMCSNCWLIENNVKVKYEVVLGSKVL